MVFDDTSAASLEQFTLLAKNARGKACVALIEQALSNKKLFVFRELLDMPNVQALKNTDHDRYFQLLEIFCYGKYSDYLGEYEIYSSQTFLQRVIMYLICQREKMDYQYYHHHKSKN